MSTISEKDKQGIDMKKVYDGFTMEEHIKRHEEFMYNCQQLIDLATRTKKNANIRDNN
jgi:hypothetical protein